MATSRPPRPGRPDGSHRLGRRTRPTDRTDVASGAARRGPVGRVALASLLLAAFGLVGCGNDPLPRGPNQRPVAELEVPESGRTGEALLFDASGSYDPDGIIVEYHFTPGDGSATRITADPYLSYAYEEPGIYTVTLTVVDDREGKASAVAPVSVE